jgi:flagellar P-ring protein precursor FlgI
MPPILRAFSVLLLAAGLTFGACAAPAAAKSRIKDIVSFEGIRGNHLVGYGLVFGLNGTGDALRNSPQTQQSLQSMLERMGVNTHGATPNPKDVAAVIVTAELPPFAAPGSTFDVTVSAMGDAKSLQGGTLVATPLIAGDGEVHGVAQGTVQTGAISASGASGTSISKGVPTAGRIAGGATIEMASNSNSGTKMAAMETMRLTLRNPDFSTAQHVADAINARFPGCAEQLDPTIVAVHPPTGMNMVAFINQVENLSVDVDAPAKVVIDEIAGVIVMDEAVRISTVAIQQGNLTITVKESSQVSQPTAFSKGGTTAIVPQSDVSVDEEKGKKFVTLRNGASLSSLVAGLNALGVTPRDMISILQSIKTAGALQADIQVQ